LDRGLAVEHERGTGKPLVSLARHGETWSGSFDGDGGFARRGIAGVRCSEGSRGYGPSKLAQKRQEGWAWLTELRTGLGSGAGLSTVRSCGGARSCSRGPGARVVLRASDLHGKVR